MSAGTYHCTAGHECAANGTAPARCPHIVIAENGNRRGCPGKMLAGPARSSRGGK